MSNWSAELDDLVRGRLRYISASGNPIDLDIDEIETLVGTLVSFTQDRMKDAFSAGHALGATSNIPSDQLYDFDESLDKFHASSKFSQWLSDYEAK